MTIETVYNIPAWSNTVEVYGDSENGWYEWRLFDFDGAQVQDTGRERYDYAPSDMSLGRQYGTPESALRDALMVASGEPDPFIENMRMMDARIKAQHGPQQ